MSSTISALTAAQLSQAACIPLTSWQANPTGAAPLPAGRQAVPSLSNYGGTATDPDATVQVTAFANESTRQLVFTFKGSDKFAT